MAKDPAFLFYSQDFYTGVATLDWEERGKFISILCLMHQQGRMSEETIRFLVGSVSVNLKSKFSIDENGLWYNKRLEEESEKRRQFTESRRNNGLLGGRPKANAKPNGKANAKHMGNHMENENEDAIEYGIKSKHFLIIKSEYLNGERATIYGTDGLVDYITSKKSVLPEANNLSIGEFIKKYKGKMFNDFRHLYNSWLKFIENGTRN